MSGRGHVLDGRQALVTGAGRGIGRAVAIALARAGADVTLAARTRAELDATAVACKAEGRQARVCVCDVAHWSDVRELAAGAARNGGRLDAVIHAAGVYGPIGPTVEVDPEDWKRAIEINLIGTFHVCRAAGPLMAAQGGGKIVLFAGGGATSPLPFFASYAAAKAAVVRLAETLAEELRDANVQVNAIAPGLVDTRLQDDVLAAGRRAGPLFEKIRTARETGEGAVHPDLAADLAVFLASDESGQLTGKLISAPHDPWREWAGRGEEINASPLYTVRRIDPYTLSQLP